MSAAPALAQIGNSDDPIEITAQGSAEYLRSEGKIVYTKDVRVVQGKSQITADRLTVLCVKERRSSGGEGCSDISQIQAEGRVRYQTPNEVITGDKVEYDAVNEVITITGDVILQRPDEGVAQGTRVVYNVREGRATITSDNRPVVGIFNSSRRKDPSGAAPN